MKKKVKWILWALAGLIAVGYGLYTTFMPITVPVIKVKTSDVSQTFKEEGIVVAATENLIFSAFGGEIIYLGVEEGQQVKKGDILVRFSTDELENQINQLVAQKNSIRGQRAEMRDEVEQQLQSLRAELESIEGQKMQAETEPYTAQLEQITLMLQEANRQLEVFKNDYEKIKILYENGAVSKAELENQERAIEQQENIIKQHEKQIELLKEQHTLPEGTEQYFEGLKDSIRTQIKFLERRFAQLKGNATGGTSEYFESQDKSIEYQIKQLESKLSKAEVIAPIDGIIKGVKIEQGMVIPEAMELFTIFQPNSYQIETMVHMEEVMDINEGMPVKIIMDRRDEDILFSGTIVEIAPSAIETISPLGLEERRVKVTIVPDEFDVKLRPGYALDVEFTTVTEKDVLAVPKTALFPLDENTDAVWVEKDGRARIQPIEKGLETTDEVVIKKGLEDGDIVITNPQFEGLKEGVRIRY